MVAQTTKANVDCQEPNIALVGLGIMGRAVARCYSLNGFKVHAFNRGKANRDRTNNMNLDNVAIYDDLSELLLQSDADLILMMVVADEMMKTSQSIIMSVDATLWKGKTLVQFTSHEPFAIKAQESLMENKLGANLIGGAMMAVPNTVGMDSGFFLVSAGNLELIEAALPKLKVLGTVVSFQGKDVALASLADIGLLQGLQFGLAGNELSCAIFERYGVDQNFKDTYVELIPKTTVPILEFLSQEAALSIFKNSFKDQANTYTAAAHRAVYEAHQYFFERMGLRQSTYLSLYLEQFRKVPNSKTEGPSAIVNTYSFVDDVNGDL